MALSAIFGNASRRRRGSEDDRLLELFSNRVKLKKEFARLRNERYELEASLGRAENETSVMKRRLEYLEDLLTERQTAVSTMLFYHLRGLWRRCNRRLQHLAADMGRQIAGRRQVMQVEQWQATRKQRLAAAEQLAVEQQGAIETTKKTITTCSAERQAASKPWHFMRRRRLNEQHESLAIELKQQIIEHGQTLDQIKQLKKAKPPELAELAVADRRVINLHVLALAQFLFAHFDEYGLVERSAAAFNKQVGTIEYGSDEDCAAIMRQSDNAFKALLALERAPEFRPHLLRQAEHLKRNATYSSESAVIPEPFDVLDGAAEGDTVSLVVSEHFASPGQVLGADVWSISRAFTL